jgi:hypothetical protein
MLTAFAPCCLADAVCHLLCAPGAELRRPLAHVVTWHLLHSAAPNSELSSMIVPETFRYCLLVLALLAAPSRVSAFSVLPRAHVSRSVISSSSTANAFMRPPVASTGSFARSRTTSRRSTALQMAADFYQTLGLSRGASEAEIKTAFRKV